MTLAWYDPTIQHVSTNKDDPLFTPLGQVWPLNVERKWVGLTDEEMGQCSYDADGFMVEREVAMRAVETKLKGKNNVVSR